MTRVVLAAAHLDSDPTNNRLKHLRALCQRCHMLHDRPHHLAQRSDQIAAQPPLHRQSTRLQPTKTYVYGRTRPKPDISSATDGPPTKCLRTSIIDTIMPFIRRPALIAPSPGCCDRVAASRFLRRMIFIQRSPTISSLPGLLCNFQAGVRSAIANSRWANPSHSPMTGRILKSSRDCARRLPPNSGNRPSAGSAPPC